MWTGTIKSKERYPGFVKGRRVDDLGELQQQYTGRNVQVGSRAHGTSGVEN
jgi:hypothetical protein